MLVNQWMTAGCVTLAPTTPIGEAAALMQQRGIRRIPLTDDGTPTGRILGMVTKSDVLRAAPADLNPFSPSAATARALSDPLRRIMRSPAVMIAGDAPLEVAAQRMADRKIGGLPVVSQQRLVGILTESDVFRALVAALGVGDRGLRITLDVSNDEDGLWFAMDLARRHGMRLAGVTSFERDGRRAAVLRLNGGEPPGLVDELWASGRRVLSVLRLPLPGG